MLHLQSNARGGRGSVLAVALATVLLLAACDPRDPKALTAHAVTLQAPSSVFLGDGLQHGPVGAANYRLVRDGVAAARMPDGWTLNLFSDTSPVPGSGPAWLITNSAAMSPPGMPQALQERLVNGKPKPVLPWTPAEAAQVVGGKYYPGIWPTGATWVPNDIEGGGRVLISYHRVGTDTSVTPATYTRLGQGIAEYRYKDAATAVADGIEATRLNDDLFPGDNVVSMGSPVYHRGWVYLWGCDLPAITCYGARAKPWDIANGSRWAWWDGNAYVATRAERKPIGVGEFSEPRVQWVAAYDAFAMVNGRTGDQAVIRWSAVPSGPWTAPQFVKIPGCGKSLYENGCYLPEVRPESTPTMMKLTYAVFGTSETHLAGIAVQKP